MLDVIKKKSNDELRAKAASDWKAIEEKYEPEVEHGLIETQTAPATPVADIDGYIKFRKAFIKKVNAIFVEGKDYHVIQGKKSMAKGGAEKLASIFGWTALFGKDEEALEMLGDIPGLVAYKCSLMKGTNFAGEGRGAAILSKNAGDPNKTLKMAQKSAFIDAVLRASGLSDFFTQDLENMPAERIVGNREQAAAQESWKQQKLASPKQAKLIASLRDQKKITPEKYKELCKKYPTPSDMIDHLLGVPSNY